MVAASALAGVAVPMVHAGEDNTINVALIGCGGTRDRSGDQRSGGAGGTAQASGDGGCFPGPTR